MFIQQKTILDVAQKTRYLFDLPINSYESYFDFGFYSTIWHRKPIVEKRNVEDGNLLIFHIPNILLGFWSKKLRIRKQSYIDNLIKYQYERYLYASCEYFLNCCVDNIYDIPRLDITNSWYDWPITLCNSILDNNFDVYNPTKTYDINYLKKSFIIKEILQ